MSQSTFIPLSDLQSGVGIVPPVDVPPREEGKALMGAVEPGEAQGRGETVLGVGGMPGTSTSATAEAMDNLTHFGLSLATDDKERALYLQQHGFEPYMQDKKLLFKDKSGKVYDPTELTKEERGAYMVAREGPMLVASGLSFAGPLGKLASPLGSMATRFARIGGAASGGAVGSRVGDEWYNFLRQHYGYTGLTPEQKASHEKWGAGVSGGMHAVGEVTGTLGATTRLNRATTEGRAEQEAKLQNMMSFEVSKKGVDRINLQERIGNLTFEVGDKNYNRIVDELTGVAIRDAAGADIPEIRALGRETVAAMGKRRDKVVGAYFETTRGIQEDLGTELKGVVAPHLDKVLSGDISNQFEGIISNVTRQNPNINLELAPGTMKLLTEGAKLTKARILPPEILTAVKGIENTPGLKADAKVKQILGLLNDKLGRPPRVAELNELRTGTTPATVGDLLTQRDKLVAAAKVAKKPIDQIALSEGIKVVDGGLVKLGGLKQSELKKLQNIQARYADFENTIDKKMTSDIAKSQDSLQALDTVVSNSRKHPRAARMFFDALQKHSPEGVELFKNAWIEKLVKTQSTTEAVQTIGDMDPRILKQMFGSGAASKLSNWYKFPNQLRSKRAEVEFWMKTPEGQAAFQGEARRILDEAGGAVGQEVRTPDQAAMDAFREELGSPGGVITKKAKYAAASALGGYGILAHKPGLIPLASAIIGRDAFFQSIAGSPRASEAYFKWLNSPTAKTARQAAYYATRVLVEATRTETKPPETQEMARPKLSPAATIIKDASPAVQAQASLAKVEESKSKVLQTAKPNSGRALNEAMKSQDLKPNQWVDVLRDMARPKLAQEARDLSLPDLMRAVQAASPEEKKQLLPLLKNKYRSTITTFEPQVRQQLQQQYGQVLMQGSQAQKPQ